jgi:DNA-directed RNA polymerase subunit RPC12/RpoP
MPRYVCPEPDWENDADAPDVEDWGDDDDADEATIACPNCGREVFEDSPRCPHCGEFILEEDSAASTPWWIVLGVLLCLAAVLVWVVL